MKYFSELTKRVYETVEELEAAEKVEQEKLDAEAAKKAKRAEKAKEVEQALADVNAAYKHYTEVLEAFCKDYGAYHTTLTGDDELFNLIYNRVFNKFLF